MRKAYEALQPIGEKLGMPFLESAFIGIRIRRTNSSVD